MYRNIVEKKNWSQNTESKEIKDNAREGIKPIGCRSFVITLFGRGYSEF